MKKILPYILLFSLPCFAAENPTNSAVMVNPSGVITAPANFATANNIQTGTAVAAQAAFASNGVVSINLSTNGWQQVYICYTLSNGVLTSVATSSNAWNNAATWAAANASRLSNAITSFNFGGVGITNTFLYDNSGYVTLDPAMGRLKYAGSVRIDWGDPNLQINDSGGNNAIYIPYNQSSGGIGQFYGMWKMGALTLTTPVAGSVSVTHGVLYTNSAGALYVSP